MSLKFLAGTTIFVTGFATLSGLGYWQVQRAAWKEGVLNSLAQEYQKHVSQTVLTSADFLAPEKNNFKVVRGNVQGHFLAQNRTLLWPVPYEGNYGFSMLDGFRLESGEIIMVDRGWIDENLQTKKPVAVILPPPPKIKVSISGLVRAREENFFTLDNNPAENRWYKFRENEIAAYLGEREVLPLVLYAEEIGGAPENSLGTLKNSKILPANNHAQYAAFWFAMALLWFLICGRALLRNW
jgi:surfeit locus 1 family protein